jgi:LacI family transcriptional regulator
MLFNDFIPSVKANFVYCNVELGMEMAVKYLVSKEKKKIAFLKGPTLIHFGKDDEAATVPSIDVRDKFNGFKKGMEETGLAICQEWVRECANYNKDEGYQQTKVLINGKNSPNAILCSNDELALGCLEALQEAKIQCPKEVAVMGFDGIETGAFSTPPLTTVEQLLDQMGLEGAQKLVDILEGRKRDPIHVGFVPQLLVRKSA